MIFKKKSEKIKKEIERNLEIAKIIKQKFETAFQKDGFILFKTEDWVEIYVSKYEIEFYGKNGSYIILRSADRSMYLIIDPKKIEDIA